MIEGKEWQYKSGINEEWSTIVTKNMWHHDVAVEIAKHEYEKYGTVRVHPMIIKCDRGYIKDVVVEPVQTLEWKATVV